MRLGKRGGQVQRFHETITEQWSGPVVGGQKDQVKMRAEIIMLVC
jgi:hypothetical protein